MKYPFMYWCAVLVMALTGESARSADTSPVALALTISKHGSFEVVSHRMDPVGIGIVAGGLVGAAIESGIHSSKDDDMKKRLLESYPDASCDKALIEAFKTRIDASGVFTLGGGKAATVVDIEISECGVHLAESSEQQYASYVYLKLKVKPGTGPSWIEPIQVSGRNRYDFEGLVNKPGLAQSEVEDVLTRAGTRAADKLIYKK